MAKGKKSIEQTLKGDLWLLGTLYSAGDEGLTLKELSDLWQKNAELSRGEPLSRYTFIKRRRAIGEVFGIRLIYTRKKYSIRFDSDTGLGIVRRELVRTIAVLNLLADNPFLDERMQFDDFKKENEYVFPLLNAIKNQTFVTISYKGDGKQQKVLFKPLFLKFKWRRWYIIGDKYIKARRVMDHIALDSIKEITYSSARQVEDIAPMDDYMIPRPYGFK